MKALKRIGLLVLVAMLIIQISPITALAENMLQTENGQEEIETTVEKMNEEESQLENATELDSKELLELPELEHTDIPTPEEQSPQEKQDIQESYIDAEKLNMNRAVISDNIFTGVQLEDINGASLTDKRIEYGSSAVIKLAFNFDGKSYNNGDEFKFTLPDTFNFGTANVGGNMTNGLAKWELDVTTREFKITFLADQQDGQYEVKLSTAFKGPFSEIGASTKQQVDFPTKDQNTVFDLNFIPATNITNIFASLSPSQVNPDKVIVNGRFNLQKEEGTKGTLKINDSVNAGANGTTIDKSTIAVYESDVNGSGGFIGPKKELVEGVDYILVATDTSVEVQLTNGLNGKAYQVSYEKKINKPNDQLTTITTVGQTIGDNVILSSNTSILRPKLVAQSHLEKAYTYDSESRTITWTIAVNYDQTILSKGDLLKDILDDSVNSTPVNGVEYIQDSMEIKEVRFNPSDGTTIIGGDAKADWSITNIAKNGSFDMAYEKDNSSKSYQIQYKTKITDFTEREIKNTVQLNDEDSTESSMSIGPSMLHKEGGTIDYFNNKMDWTITANADRIQVRSLHIEDEFSTGVKELLTHQVYAHDGDEKTLLKEGVDYTLTKGLADLDGRKRDGFLIKLIGPYNITDKKITVELSVKIDLSEVNGVTPKIVNKTRIWYYDKDNEYQEDEAEAEESLQPNIANNGGKFGQYNEKTGYVDWVVSLNTTKKTYNKLIFDDLITGRHQLIKDSVRFREVVSSDELSNPKSVLESRDYLLTDKDDNYPTAIELNEKDMHLEFGNIKNKRVFVLYSTEPEEKWYFNGSVHNTVTVSDDNADEKEYKEAVKLAINEFPLFKKANINKNANNMIDWTVYIEKATPERPIKDLKIVETLDIGQTGAKFISNSIKVTNSETGEIVSPDKYSVSIVDNVMTIQFNDYTMTAQHILTYNTASEISGAVKSLTEVSSSSYGTMPVNNRRHLAQASPSFTSGSGTGIVALGNVTIIKVDEENQAKKLAGATFRLDSASGDSSIEGITNKDGMIQFKDIITGDYLLFEVTAPEGYEIQEEYQIGKPITVTKSDADNTFTITNKLKTVDGEVKLTKKASHNGELLAGAEFEIRDASNQVVGETLVTDDKGEIHASLPPGDYKLIETKAPKGYKLNATPQAFTIEKNQVEAINLTFNNDIELGDVVLMKTDKDTNVKLAGAVFELQDSKGKALQTDLTTDKDGKLLVKDLLPGDYQLVETKAPKGYKLDATPQTFTISESQVDIVELTFTNAIELGAVELTKTDKDTGATLTGAVFELQDSKGKTLQTDLTTDKDGKLQVKDLRPGDYQLVETKAPKGYKLDAAPQVFTIAESQAKAVTITFTNAIELGAVELTKTDKDTGATLSGAVFELQDSKDKVLQTDLTTDKDGKLQVKDLRPGDYQLVETKAPKGYKLDATPQLFTIAESQAKAVTITFGNAIELGAVVLTKTDKDTGTTLSGAVFELQDSKGKTLQTDLTTDKDGKLQVKDLRPGGYQLVETKAPKGYKLDATPQTFTIAESQTAAVTIAFSNAIELGDVELTKTDKDTGATLSGAVFELRDSKDKVLQTDLTTNKDGKLLVKDLLPGDYKLVETKAPKGYKLDATPQTFTISENQAKAVTITFINEVELGDVVLTKTDKDTGEALSGAVFELRDNKDKVLQTNLTTDNDGKLLVKGLLPGDYKFVETKAPDGYKLNATPQAFKINENQSSLVSVTFSNEIELGDVELTKTDKETGVVLAGAVFELRDRKDKVLQSDLTTNKDGKLLIKDLRPGDYQLVETKAPKGYQLDATPQVFTISKSQTGAVTITFGNEVELGDVTLTKTDKDTGTTLSGAVFELRDSKDNVLQSSLTTDDDGKLLVKDLRPGDYQLVETKAPKGYRLDTTPQVFTISESQIQAVTITFDNAIELGNVELTKEDKDTGATLAGAVFELRDDKDTVLQTDLTTDKNGKLLVKDLRPGDYQLVETKAPKGYYLDATPQPFTISESQAETLKMTFSNTIELGDVELTKTDQQTGDTLSGAVFELRDSKGTVLQTDLATDKDGKLLVKDLRPGDYQFVEVTAPIGYVLDQTPVTVTIQLGQVEQSKVTKTNAKEENLKEDPKDKPKEEPKEGSNENSEDNLKEAQKEDLKETTTDQKQLPLTGEQVSYISLGIGVVLIAGVTIFFITKKKKK